MNLKFIWPVLLIFSISCKSPNRAIRAAVDSVTLIDYALKVPVSSLSEFDATARREMLASARASEEAGSIYWNVDPEGTSSMELTVLDKNHVVVISVQRGGEDCTQPAEEIELFEYDGAAWKKMDNGLPKIKETDFYDHQNSTGTRDWILNQYGVVGDSLLLKIGMDGRGDSYCFMMAEGGDEQSFYYDPSSGYWSKKYDRIVNTISGRKFSKLVYSWDTTLHTFLFSKKEINPEWLTSTSKVADKYYEDSNSIIQFLDSCGIGHYGDINSYPKNALINIVEEEGKWKYSNCVSESLYLTLGDKGGSENPDVPSPIPALIQESTAYPINAVVHWKEAGRVLIFVKENQTYPALTAEYDESLSEWIIRYGTRNNYLGFEFQKVKLGQATTPCEFALAEDLLKGSWFELTHVNATGRDEIVEPCDGPIFSITIKDKSIAVETVTATQEFALVSKVSRGNQVVFNVNTFPGATGKFMVSSFMKNLGNWKSEDIPNLMLDGKTMVHEKFKSQFPETKEECSQ